MILRRYILASALAYALATKVFAADAPAPLRPTTWAQPVTIPGVANCYQVTTNLYRGAQPTAAGVKALQAHGIKSIINLRTFHSDANKLRDTPLASLHLRTEPWHAEVEDTVAFLRFMSDTNHLPAFVHCQRGADRTGIECAMYRLVVCGWKKDDALAEMRDGGFHFASVWKNLTNYLAHADVEKIQHAVTQPAATN
jgi:protein tyrosine/serine phosphatase